MNSAILLFHHDYLTGSHLPTPPIYRPPPIMALDMLIVTNAIAVEATVAADEQSPVQVPRILSRGKRLNGVAENSL